MSMQINPTLPNINPRTYNIRLISGIRKDIESLDAREKEILNLINDFEGEMNRIHHLRIAKVEEIQTITDELNN